MLRCECCGCCTCCECYACYDCCGVDGATVADTTRAVTYAGAVDVVNVSL